MAHGCWSLALRSKVETLAMSHWRITRPSGPPYERANPYNNCTRHYTTVGHSCKSVRQYAESAYQQNKMAAML